MQRFMQVFCIILAPFEAFLYRLTHASYNNLCLYNVNQVNSFQRNKIIHQFSCLALLTPRTELYIPGFHCLYQDSHHMQISWSTLQIQDGTKAFQISNHITPSTVLILVFLPLCSNLDLHVHRFYISCLMTCLYFSLLALEGGKMRLGRKVKAELQLK